VADRAVLAGRVHRLEDDDDSVRVLGGEAHLGLRQELDALGEELLCLGRRHLARAGRVEVAR
jgi:hypothetical protein